MEKDSYTRSQDVFGEISGNTECLRKISGFWQEKHSHVGFIPCQGKLSRRLQGLGVSGMGKQKMKTIFEYIDYRKYLSDFYEDRKKNSRAFSHRYFARKAGVSSPALLKQVIDGDRNLSAAMIEKFARGLDLKGREEIYFRNLVRFNQSATAGEKQEYYAVLRSMMHLVDEKVLSSGFYDYFSNWYNPVMRELVCLFDLGEDYTRMAAMVHPKISPGQAKKAIELLVKLKLIQKDSKTGRWVQKDPALASENQVVSLALRNFNRKMMENALEAQDAFNIHQRHISGLTFSCSEELFQVLNMEILAFKERIVNLVNQRNQNHDRVIQMNVQMFPLTRNGKSREGGA